MLVKSKIPTPDQMVQIDKEANIQKTNAEKIKASIQRRNIIRIEDEEEESPSSSMSMFNLDSDKEDLDVPSQLSPTVILHNAQLPMHLEEIHISPVTEKIPSERHSVI